MTVVMLMLVFLVGCFAGAIAVAVVTSGGHHD